MLCGGTALSTRCQTSSLSHFYPPPPQDTASLPPTAKLYRPGPLPAGGILCWKGPCALHEERCQPVNLPLCCRIPSHSASMPLLHQSIYPAPKMVEFAEYSIYQSHRPQNLVSSGLAWPTRAFVIDSVLSYVFPEWCLVRGHEGHVERPLTECLEKSRSAESRFDGGPRPRWSAASTTRTGRPSSLFGHSDRKCFRSLASFFFESSKSQSESEDHAEHETRGCGFGARLS